jgi:O-antigen/teichoic acid export membrane protein
MFRSRAEQAGAMPVGRRRYIACIWMLRSDSLPRMTFNCVSTRHAASTESSSESMSSAAQASGQRAARDIVMQVVVRIGNLALGVVATALLARTLGSAGYGQWSTALAVLALVGYLGTFGVEAVAVREAAREPETEHEWLGAVMLLRLYMLGPAVVLSVLAIVLLHHSHEMLVAGLILVITMPFNGVGALQLVFQLRVNNLVPMLVLTLRSVLWTAAVAVIYLRGGSMITLAIALTATNAIGSVVQALAALRAAPRRPRPSRKRIGVLLRHGLPIGISGVLVIAYARIDQLIVFSLSGSRPAGLYGGVYNVLDQAHFVPISILTTLAPIMAASWPANRERLLRTARLSAEVMAVASFGALAFASVAASPLILLFYGREFLAAAPALPILGGAFIFICFGYLNDNLLVILGLQQRRLVISLLALVVNVAGNLILVPIDGFMGAAWMTLATEAVVCGASLWLILRELDMSFPSPGRLGRTLLAAVLMAAGLDVIRLLGAPLALLVVAACVTYPTLLFGLRALTLDELRILLRREALA